MFVLSQRRGAIFEVILNRPDKRNALNLTMMQEIEAAFDTAEQDAGIRAILVRGEGKGFSAGIDVMSFPEIAGHFGEDWNQNLFPMTAMYQGIFNKIERCRHPVIALLHGFCLGMGLELALACDLRLAAEGTQIGLPETRLGLIPDVGGTTRLTRLVGPARAKELIMTGRTFNAEYAERWGIVNRVVKADALLQQGENLVEELAQAAPLAVSYAKKVIDGITDIDRGLQLEAWAQSILIRSQDFERGVQSMMTGQAPDWRGQ